MRQQIGNGINSATLLVRNVQSNHRVSCSRQASRFVVTGRSLPSNSRSTPVEQSPNSIQLSPEGQPLQGRVNCAEGVYGRLFQAVSWLLRLSDHVLEDLADPPTRVRNKRLVFPAKQMRS